MATEISGFLCYGIEAWRSVNLPRPTLLHVVSPIVAAYRTSKQAEEGAKILDGNFTLEKTKDAAIFFFKECLKMVGINVAFSGAIYLKNALQMAPVLPYIAPTTGLLGMAAGFGFPMLVEVIRNWR